MGHSPVAGGRVTGRWKPRGGPSPACGLPSCQLAEGQISQAGKCDSEGQRGTARLCGRRPGGGKVVVGGTLQEEGLDQVPNDWWEGSSF